MTTDKPQEEDETLVFASTPEDDDHRFGKYQVIDQIGKGGMGIVYKCYDPDFQRPVAVKTIFKKYIEADQGSEFLRRFKHEMIAAARVTHGNVVAVYDAGVQGGAPYLVMEFVDGCDLKQIITDDAPLTIERSIDIMKKVLRGLACVHQQGIVHRDIKPANIFLTKAGEVKLADFGIAKLDTSELTKVGTVMGSPKYMSPEQCRGDVIDHRSDLFSLGVIFYQMLTNKHCFSAESMVAITQKILAEEPDKPSLLRPDVPKAIDKVVMKALQKKTDQRYQSVDEFLHALDAIDITDKNAGSKMVLPAIIGLVVAVVAVIVGVLLFNQDDPQVATVPTGSSVSEPANQIDKVKEDTPSSQTSTPVVSSSNQPDKVKQQPAQEVQNQTTETQAQTQTQTQTKETQVTKAAEKGPSKAVSTMVASVIKSMVAIPGGDFKMGYTSAGVYDARPLHDVYVGSFKLQKHHFTVGDYNVYLSAMGKGRKSGHKDQPVTNVSWDEAQSFISWLNKMSGKRFRLPTESEWEYAARTASKYDFPWGKRVIKNKANCANCDSQYDNRSPSPYTAFKPNGYGLYDMYGNVWEWMQDCYVNNYNEAPTTSVPVEFKNCQRRVLRGGAWNSDKKEIHPGYRNASIPDFESNSIGFRLAM